MTPKLRRFAQPIYQLLAATVSAWFDRRAASKGAALAFYTLFSMTPTLVLAVVVAGYVFGTEAAEGKIIAEMQGMVGRNGAQAISALLLAARNSDSGVLTSLLASGFLLLAATSVFVELKGSLDELWGGSNGTGNSSRSAFLDVLKTRLVAFALVFILALLLLLSLLASAALALLGRYAGSELATIAFALASLSSMMSFTVIVCLFAVLYKMLPERQLSWRDVWTGALFTAGLFSLGKYAIGLYLTHSAIASGFGAAGSVIALLLWVYYSAQIFFLGAEFTRQYALRYGSLRNSRLNPETPAGRRDGR